MKGPALADALSSVRGLVEADGADLHLVSVDEDARTVSLRLVLDGVDCHECVLAKPLLEEIAANVMRRSLPGLLRVSIDDPRAR